MGVRLTWNLSDIGATAERLRKLSRPLSVLTRAIAGRLEKSTHKRFEDEEDPNGKSWVKGFKTSGKTLTVSNLLNQSITSEFDEQKAVVGTNLRYAAIHQNGGTITAKNKPFLTFKVNGQWVKKKSVTVPARPFLGISADDEIGIQDIVKRYLNGEF